MRASFLLCLLAFPFVLGLPGWASEKVDPLPAVFQEPPALDAGLAALPGPTDSLEALVTAITRSEFLLIPQSDEPPVPFLEKPNHLSKRVIQWLDRTDERAIIVFHGTDFRRGYVLAIVVAVREASEEQPGSHWKIEDALRRYDVTYGHLKPDTLHLVTCQIPDNEQLELITFSRYSGGRRVGGDRLEIWAVTDNGSFRKVFSGVTGYHRQHGNNFIDISQDATLQIGSTTDEWQIELKRFMTPRTPAATGSMDDVETTHTVALIWDPEMKEFSAETPALLEMTDVEL